MCKPERKNGATNRNSFKRTILNYFKEYCRGCTLDALPYIGQDRTPLEIIFWTIVFLVAIAASLYMIYEICFKWIQSPVIVSFASKRLPIYEVPLPAITICPVNKIFKQYFDYSKYNKEAHSQDDRDELAGYMQLICSSKPHKKSNQTFVEPDRFFNAIQKSRVPLIINAITDGSITSNIQFEETYTEQGLCYTYNRLKLSEIYSDNVLYHGTDGPYKATWSMVEGYKKGIDLRDEYPRRAKSAGMTAGIKISIIEMGENGDLDCDPILQGYRITLHSPGRIPNTNADYFMIPLNDVTAISVDASMILTSGTVKNYKPEKRDCYFASERKLKYFKAYTQKNCQLECVVNATLKQCGCVEFYMPYENGTKVCGPGSRPCLKNIKLDTDGASVCNCLSMCTDITYHGYVEPISVKSDRMKQITSEYSKKIKGPLQFSIVMLYFRDNRISTTERNELYGISDFISNFGGLLGLFTGFSILSCLEIIYFLSLRIIGNIKLYGYWAGPNN